MSRLDSAINRLTAQRDCLAMAASLIDGFDGPVLEIGLGNGRTYDHLHSLMPARRIFVFERQLAAHLDSTPPDADLLLGDLADTLPRARERIGARAVLAHADIGCGDEAVDRATAALLSRWLPGLLAPAGIVLCDQSLDSPRLEPLSPPASVAPDRYFCYRVAGDHE